MLVAHTKPSAKPVKIIERSLHLAQYIFVENQLKTNKMHGSEYQVLTSWFDFILSSNEIDISIDLIMYLKVRIISVIPSFQFLPEFQSTVYFIFCFRRTRTWQSRGAKGGDGED